jgi:hypothetical protein
MQLDICKEMASIGTGPATKFSMHNSEFSCLGSGDITCWGDNNIGKCSHFSSREEYYRHGCDHEWYSTSAGLLFYHVVVENSVAKLKYASPLILYISMVIYLCYLRYSKSQGTKSSSSTIMMTISSFRSLVFIILFLFN